MVIKSPIVVIFYCKTCVHAPLFFSICQLFEVARKGQLVALKVDAGVALLLNSILNQISNDQAVVSPSELQQGTLKSRSNF